MLRWSATQCSASSAADPGRDLRAPVATLRAVARVAEPRHQLANARAMRHVSQPRVRRRTREAVTGQRRCDHVERLASSGPDHVEELHDRTRPTVREQQRQRVLVRRSRVHEVDRLPVDLGAELRELIEPRFLRAPVVRVAPVLHQSAQIAERDPVLPAGARDLVGQPRPPRAGGAGRRGPRRRRRSRRSRSRELGPRARPSSERRVASRRGGSACR